MRYDGDMCPPVAPSPTYVWTYLKALDEKSAQELYTMTFDRYQGEGWYIIGEAHWDSSGTRKFGSMMFSTGYKTEMVGGKLGYWSPLLSKVPEEKLYLCLHDVERESVDVLRKLDLEKMHGIEKRLFGQESGLPHW